ncbi:GNAT family N-acetyltransferase [Sporosarcina sp. P33]|uniref:GNAT family N-acetyltransferase n=1 Tax=Sporosarcina sp. P33 TaxID=1930764 RepID=UPI0009C229FE|nr:GNAT family N-acetyltransferase [Sporosarcina sp. P33]ARD47070.1 GNAT family acetyltransferase [Sporosarcina sp. P33]
MDYIVRDMAERDCKRVQDIALESWRATYEGIIPREIQDDFLRVAYSDEMMESRLAGSHVFVAEVAGEVVGFADFSPVDETGRTELRAIYFYPQHQGKGMGTALLRKGIEELGGVKEIVVEVEKENIVGKQFYEAKGFKPIREYVDDFAGHSLKTVQMVLTV